MFGRTIVYTDEPVITSENVVNVLSKVLPVHAKNQGEIEYLWNYYRGKTPILGKTKEIRETINHKVNINRAYEIVSFKMGYGFGEPVQYIRHGKDETLSDEVNTLNEYMFLADKHAADSELAEWLYVCGFGMRMLLPGPNADEPFKIYTLDPRHSFVVRYNGLGEPVVMGVKAIIRENGMAVYSVYTKDRYFEIENGVITKNQAHVLGDVPIFEYPANQARLGAFEIVLSTLDAINELESNRMDDVVQFVNAILAITGGTMDEETLAKLKEYTMLCLPEGVDAKYISTSLQQNDIQVLIDDLTDSYLTICGIPNRNGGSSTSDTGSAVIMRDGWQNAESQMKSVELQYKKSDNRFLRMALRILKDMTGVKLEPRNVEIKFSRRNYDNLQTKSQVLTTLLNSPKVHPELAYYHCGMFLDPESAYLQSKEWWEANEAKMQEQMAAESEEETDDPDSLPEV